MQPTLTLGPTASKHTPEQEYKRPIYKTRVPEGGLGRCPDGLLKL